MSIICLHPVGSESGGGATIANPDPADPDPADPDPGATIGATIGADPADPDATIGADPDAAISPDPDAAISPDPADPDAATDAAANEGYSH